MKLTIAKKSVVVALGAAVLSLGLIAGTPQVADAADSCEGRTEHFIYYATHAIPHPVWETVRRGAVRGAEDNCLRMKWTQSDTFSIEDTVNRMEAAVAEKPDLLVITATDPVAMRPTLEKAAADGIPVIAINVEDPAPRGERVPYLLYIGADMYLSGMEAAQLVLAERAQLEAGALSAQRAGPCRPRRHVPGLPRRHERRLGRTRRSDPCLARH